MTIDTIKYQYAVKQEYSDWLNKEHDADRICMTWDEWAFYRKYEVLHDSSGYVLH